MQCETVSDQTQNRTQRELSFRSANRPTLTYIYDLFDEVVAAAVGENLPLRRLVVEQDVEGGVLVRIRPLVVRTAM